MTDPREQDRRFGKPVRDASDMFAVDAAYQTIPPSQHGGVPETREEKRRRLVIRLTIAAIAVVIGLIVTVTALHLMNLAEIEDAIALADNDGRPASIAAALDIVPDDNPEDRAIRARLLAMLALQGDRSVDEAVALVTRDIEEDEGGVDRLIAATYVALAQGDEVTAVQNASRLNPQGDLAAEAARARGLAALAVANFEQALGQARLAAESSPESPRHAALLADVQSASGQAAEALETVSSFADAGHPAARLARVRAHLYLGTELETALGEAVAVAEDEAATAAETAWAGLLAARIHALEGARAPARTALERAREQAPPGDERFVLDAADVRLRIGDVREAEALLESLGESQADPARRHLLEAAVLVAKGDRDAATQALSRLPEGPRVALLRGRLSAARGSYDDARRDLATAARDPLIAVEAQLAHAQVEVADGKAAAAGELLQPLLEARPTHPEIAAIGADIERAHERHAEAEQIVRRALEAHPDDGLLLTALGRVQMAREQWREAFDSLTRAVENDATDPSRHTDRGIAARRIDNDDVARQAFDAALELSPEHPAALLARLDLALDERDLQQAEAMMERVDDADIDTLDVERLRARTLVLGAQGMAGIRQVRQGLVRRGTHPDLYEAMGRLYIQGEQYDSAASILNRAVSLQGETPSPETRLLEALAYARARRVPPVTNILAELPAELPATVDALRKTVEGWVAWVSRGRARARERAIAALALDPHQAQAHLLLATIGEDTVTNLRAATTAKPPLPEAMGRLVLAVEDMPESDRCDLVRAYLRAAPRGEDASDVRETYRCR
jgi:tetratricopeptide (TPR) repeat protein